VENEQGIWRCAILSILVLTLTPVEWGQDSHSHTSPSTPESSGPELVGSMHVMHAAMASVRPSGDNDADFVRLMLPHHQAAIDMAKTQLAYGQDAQMRRLAQEIITTAIRNRVDAAWLRQREAKSSSVKHYAGIHTGKEQ